MSIRSCFAAGLMAVTAGACNAQNLVTYVDADSTGPGGIETGNTVDTGVVGFDFWQVRDFGVGGDVFQFNTSEGSEAIELATTISGLDPGTSYNFYVFFWDDTATPDWFVDASLAGPSADASAFTNFNAGGVIDNFNGPVFEAAALPFANPGDVNTSSELVASRPGVFNEIDLQLGVAGNDTTTTDGLSTNQDLFAGLVGTAVAPGNGQVEVFIRNVSGANRVWYDGVGFQVAGGGLVGDTNGDGDVDLLDYNEIASRIGGPPVTPGSLGDVFADGVVDLRDFAAWSQNRTDLPGMSVSQAATQTPEPSTLAVAGLAGLAFGCIARRRA